MSSVRKSLFLITSVIFLGSVSNADKGLSTIRDANASYFGGDLFRAVGLYEMALEQKTDKLFTDGLEGYVASMRVLSTDKAFDEFCKSLISSSPGAKAVSASAYACAKNFLQAGKLKDAEKNLSIVSKESEWFLPSQIMLATSKMGRGDGEGCLKILKVAPEKEYKKRNLADLLALTSGRCKVTAQRLAEAIQDYQSISTSSKYYLEAVQETAWLNFKLRKLETSRVLANAFISTYENFHKADTFKSETVMNISNYFQVRYLSAYSELVQGRYDAAEESFEKLKFDFRKYSKEETDKLSTPEKFLQDISENSKKWVDIKAMSNESIRFLDYVELWSGVKFRTEIEKEVLYIMSLQKEMGRYDKRSYETDSSRTAVLQQLLGLEKLKLKDVVNKNYQLASQTRNTVELKAELGRLEIGWLNRTQGVKSMDQAIEVFKQEVKSVDEYFGI